MERIQRLSKAQITELSGIINSNKSSFTEGKKAQAVLMVNTGKEPEDIAMLTGYSRRHAFALRIAYIKYGLKVIKDKPRKIRRLLTGKERTQILDMIKNQKPSDYGYQSSYWSTGILGMLIKKEYGVEYKSKNSVRLLFKEAKFSYHKPDKKYQRHNEKNVEQWLIEKRPSIEEAMSDPNTIVLTGDEMQLSTQTTTQRVWLPQGEYPKIDVATKRESLSLYGFLEIKTGKEYAFKTPWQNMYLTEKILKKLRKLFPGKKILIIWDQAGWHRGSVVKKYIEKTKGKIETMFFPAASPELNPQEHVWKAGRSNVTHNEFIENIDKAADQFVNFLNKTKFTYSFAGFKC